MFDCNLLKNGNLFAIQNIIPLIHTCFVHCFIWWIHYSVSVSFFLLCVWKLIECYRNVCKNVSLGCCVSKMNYCLLNLIGTSVLCTFACTCLWCSCTWYDCFGFCQRKTSVTKKLIAAWIWSILHSSRKLCKWLGVM